MEFAEPAVLPCSCDALNEVAGDLDQQGPLLEGNWVVLQEQVWVKVLDEAGCTNVVVDLLPAKSDGPRVTDTLLVIVTGSGDLPSPPVSEVAATTSRSRRLNRTVTPESTAAVPDRLLCHVRPSTRTAHAALAALC
ncbi:hypothetical protein AB0N81_32800 [Streptomyces sp. NPDC093510]|uniref:hypothetical protein n=1 Tax=Streptomyces sp. NPDC093510 TaxID=3155199 RepID=UPI00343FAEF0